MTKDEILAALVNMGQAASSLEEDEFITREYAEEAGIGMGVALKKLVLLQSRGILTSRKVKYGSTNTTAWKPTNHKALMGQEKKK